MDCHTTGVPGAAAMTGYPLGLDPIPEFATARSAQPAAERLPVHSAGLNLSMIFAAVG
jgi:hypothetical protein